MHVATILPGNPVIAMKPALYIYSDVVLVQVICSTVKQTGSEEHL